MRRISYDDVRHTIYVALKVASNTHKRGMLTTLPHENDAATGAIADTLTARVMTGNVLIGASMVRHGDEPGRPGQWGVDEPYPFAELDAPPARPDTVGNV